MRHFSIGSLALSCPPLPNSPFANENETARACQLCRWLSLSLLPRTASPSLSGAPAERAAFSLSARSSSSYLVPRVVKQWVHIAHDLLHGETPLGYQSPPI